MSDIESKRGKCELVQTSSLRVGQYVSINDKPCRITAISMAKPGKHGSAKNIFQAKDLLSGKNVETSAPSKGTIPVPEVVIERYSVLDISEEDYLSLMRNGVIREDIKVEDVGTKREIEKLLKEEKPVEVTVMTVMDHVIIQSVREALE